jgi:hypothetical protein
MIGILDCIIKLNAAEITDDSNDSKGSVELFILFVVLTELVVAGMLLDTELVDSLPNIRIHFIIKLILKKTITHHNTI